VTSWKWVECMLLAPFQKHSPGGCTLSMFQQTTTGGGISFCQAMPCCCCEQGSQHSRQVALAVYRSELDMRSQYVYGHYTTLWCSMRHRVGTRLPCHSADKLSTTWRKPMDMTILMWLPCSIFLPSSTGMFHD